MLAAAATAAVAAFVTSFMAAVNSTAWVVGLGLRICVNIIIPSAVVRAWIVRIVLVMAATFTFKNSFQSLLLRSMLLWLETGICTAFVIVFCMVGDVLSHCFARGFAD